MSHYPNSAVYNKLVRDRIPDIIASDGLKYETRILEDSEVIEELLKKVVEEAKELSEAKSLEEIKTEMSDVLEILHSLAERQGFTLEEVETIRQARAAKRGRFEKGIYLVRTYKENE